MNKWLISRRTLLKGAGATLALPLLEQMIPSNVRAETVAPKRLVIFYVPNGMIMRSWTPAEEGANWTLTPTMAPLAPVKDDILVLTGLQNLVAKQPPSTAPHSGATAGFLTASHPNIRPGGDVDNAISLDQFVAQRMRGVTRFPSIELGTDAAEGVGDCEASYACAYLRHISWAGPKTPVPKEVDPSAAFTRLFGDDAAPDEASAERMQRRRQSVLDLVRERTASLQRQLGPTDRAKLDEYLTGVRELEQRVMMASSGSACGGSMPPGAPIDFRDRTRMMLDIMLMAMQCDATRVLSFMLGNGRSKRAFDFLGRPGAYHNYSHHGGRAENLEAMEAIKLWEIEQLSYLLQKMKSIQEPGGGSLLDNSVVYFASEIEDPDKHEFFNLPVLLAGRCKGAISPGRHVRYPSEPPVGNLFVSILNMLDIPETRFGETGVEPLPGLS